MSEMYEGQTLEQKGLSAWSQINIDGKYCLLFWKDIYRPKSDCDGFDFHCVDFQCDVENDKGGFDDQYYTMFHGTAYFDGVRHIYIGSEEYKEYDTENTAYFNYPDLPKIIKALQALDDLQVEKCGYVKYERSEIKQKESDNAE